MQGDGEAVVRNNPVLIGGVDNSGNIQTLSVGTDGALSASVDTATFGSTSDAAAMDADGTINAHVRGSAKVLDTRTPASLGQKTMANSFAVAVASDQSAIPVSESGTWTVTVDSEPALDVATDQAGAAHMTNVIMNDRTELTPKFKTVSVAASQTDSELVAAVTSKKLRVLAMVVSAGSTGSTQLFESGGSTTKFELQPGANGGAVLGFNPVGWFETVAGENLTVTTGAGSTTKYLITYVEV